MVVCKYVGFVLLLVLLFPLGCEQQISKTSYVQWIEDYNNGLHRKQQSGDFLIDVQYKPANYLALKASVSGDQPTTLQEDAMDSDLLEFNLTIGLKKDGVDLLDYLASDLGEKQELIYYFSYHMNDDLYLEIGEQKYPSSLWHFERSFDLKKNRTFVVAFEKPAYDFDEMTLVVNSPLFGALPVKTKIDLKNIPDYRI